MVSPTAGCSGFFRPRRMTGTAGQQVQRAPDSPEPVRSVPSRISSDSTDRKKGLWGRSRDVTISRIDDPGPVAGSGSGRDAAQGGDGVGPPCLRELAVFIHQRPVDRLHQPARPDAESLEGFRAVDHGFVAEALHELAAHPGVDGSEQAEPQAGQARRENRNGNHPSAQLPLPGVFLHDVGIGRPVGSSDLDDPASPGRRAQRGDQVFDDIFHGDRLRHGVDPAGSQHDRQLLHQGPDHLEGKASRPDDDGGPEFDGGNTGAAENPSHLLSAPKMARQFRAAPQSSQVDDAPDARLPGCGRKRFRSGTIFLGVVPFGGHRVHQVVRRRDPAHGRRERLRLEQIPFHHLGVVSGPRPQGLRPPDQAPNRVRFRFEPAEQPPADIPGGPGQQNCPPYTRHCCHLIPQGTAPIGASSSSAPSYDHAFEKNRAATSSRPTSLRRKGPGRPAAELRFHPTLERGRQE